VSVASEAAPTEAPPPEPITVTNLWDLKAEPGQISGAAQAWQRFAGKARSSRQTIDRPASALRGDAWSGDASDTYHHHRGKVGGDIDESAEVAGKISGALESVAGSLRSAQGMLTESLSAVRGRIPTSVSGDQVTFSPRKAEDISLVNTAIGEANEIRTNLDHALLDQVAKLESVRSPLGTITGAWRSVATGASDGWDLPPEAANAPGVIRVGNEVIVNTGTGNDEVEVRIDEDTGEQIVVLNGTEYRYPAGQHLTIRVGAGNDKVTVPAGTTVNLTILGGEGDDTVSGGKGRERVLGLDGMDTIDSGEGDDRVSGGADRDYIDGYKGDDVLSGGEGDDTVYGLSGNDTISGGRGKDYLEGGTGDDVIDGGAGGDMISGGRDDDTLRGGAGGDKVYSGAGEDTTLGGTGNDTAFAEEGDDTAGTERVVTVEITDVGDYIKIEGSPEFVERVQADMDMLRSSPNGAAMLGNLEQAHEDSKAIAADWPVLGGIAYQGDGLTITEYHGDNGKAHRNPDFWSGGQHPSIEYAPRFDTLENGPPVVVLYHEMAHVYDYVNDTYDDGTYDKPDNPDTPNAERVAAGLPIDHDDDPDTPDRIDPDHPYEYSENGLREEMGAPHRPRY
jgi:Effector protein/RTX calcium-binding nonapeptide repeat (4 copies)